MSYLYYEICPIVGWISKPLSSLLRHEIDLLTAYTTTYMYNVYIVLLSPASL